MTLRCPSFRLLPPPPQSLHTSQRVSPPFLSTQRPTGVVPPLSLGPRPLRAAASLSLGSAAPYRMARLSGALPHSTADMEPQRQRPTPAPLQLELHDTASARGASIHSPVSSDMSSPVPFSPGIPQPPQQHPGIQQQLRARHTTPSPMTLLSEQAAGALNVLDPAAAAKRQRHRSGLGGCGGVNRGSGGLLSPLRPAPPSEATIREVRSSSSSPTSGGRGGEGEESQRQHALRRLFAGDQPSLQDAPGGRF